MLTSHFSKILHSLIFWIVEGNICDTKQQTFRPIVHCYFINSYPLKWLESFFHRDSPAFGTWKFNRHKFQFNHSQTSCQRKSCSLCVIQWGGYLNWQVCIPVGCVPPACWPSVFWGVGHPGDASVGVSRGEASIWVASWMHPPPFNRITHGCENITFPTLRMRAVKIDSGISDSYRLNLVWDYVNGTE